jgi:hypothetical protein
MNEFNHSTSRMKTFRYISFLIILTSLLFQGCQKPSMIPSDLRTEYLIDPVNVDMKTPCLSWKLEPASPELRNLSQKSYQVLVSSSHKLLDNNTGDLWNSGIVESSNLRPVKGTEYWTYGSQTGIVSAYRAGLIPEEKIAPVVAGSAPELRRSFRVQDCLLQPSDELRLRRLFP